MTFHVQAVRRSAAPPAVVYRVLADVAHWPRWVRGLTSARIDRQGTPDPEGAGGIRVMRILWFDVAREEITESRPPNFQAYEITAGLPVSHYAGTVRIDSDGTGSRITWQSEFVPYMPGTGWVLRTVLQGTVTLLASGLARESARSAFAGRTEEV